MIFIPIVTHNKQVAFLWRGIEHYSLQTIVLCCKYSCQNTDSMVTCVAGLQTLSIILISFILKTTLFLAVKHTHYITMTLVERHCVVNHRLIGYSAVYIGNIKEKTSKPALLTLCEYTPSVTGGYPSQSASNAESVTMSWHRYEPTMSNHSLMKSVTESYGWKPN